MADRKEWDTDCAFLDRRDGTCKLTERERCVFADKKRADAGQGVSSLKSENHEKGDLPQTI